VLRVGIDLASDAAVRESLQLHGERYLRRIFTARELSECGGAEDPDPVRLATLVAAKEAAFKALRVDDRPVAWTDVEVRGSGSEHPELSLSGLAATLADQEGVSDLALSLTHGGGQAAAVVIADVEHYRRRSQQ
jgi:holo-[acyl-carrier protein] synthase